MIMAFLHNFDFCYADRARQAQQYLPHSTPYVYIRRMNVAKYQQGKGSGLRLLIKVVKKAKKLGVDTFPEASPEGTPLYLKAGAKKTGILITKNHEDNVIIGKFCMIWRNYDLL
ncbi:unnamed protein product [Adineta ricciae]|uniref:N-acetyltransferase domain-containing protein n=1 Tax=Adineta ricciae TaxID=249248 RepID=A0A815PA88_ADIRI|nr:unnamed protein product [Adineta ricciae]CAF1446177.1 unnamed protein product [Adineta ricciae]